MKRFFLLMMVFAFTIHSCSKKDEVPETYEYFKNHLTSNMNYQTITKTFGDPDKDIGSGIHIYVYSLRDGTAVWIGYSDQIVYARHMSSSNSGATLLHTIL